MIEYRQLRQQNMEVMEMKLFTFAIEENYTAERDKFLREVCGRYYSEPLWEGKKLFSFKYIK